MTEMMRASKTPFQRSGGVLLHPTSLPSSCHVGDLGPEAERFARFLAEAALSWWQTLPVGPTGYGDSPYQALSGHAGSALLVSPDLLVEDGLLLREELPREGQSGPADYHRARGAREPLLRRAFERFEARPRDPAFDEFLEENRGWLEDWALFRALKRAHAERPWTDWAPDLRSRATEALERARRTLDGEIRFERFVQFEFERQWTRLRDLCRSLGLSLLGDLPIFVAHDSVEVWIVAEDLGVVTPEVKALRDRYAFPGMRVLQFAFGSDPEAPSYRPHRYVPRCVVYTGTHDNDTTVGWFRDVGGSSSTRTPAEIEVERASALRYLGTRGDEIHWDMIRLAWMSVADVAIAPVQDLLGLGTEARMNLPGRAEGNWRWRMSAGALDARVAERLHELTSTYERVPPRPGLRS